MLARALPSLSASKVHAVPPCCALLRLVGLVLPAVVSAPCGLQHWISILCFHEWVQLLLPCTMRCCHLRRRVRKGPAVVRLADRRGGGRAIVQPAHGVLSSAHAVVTEVQEKRQCCPCFWYRSVKQQLWPNTQLTALCCTTLCFAVQVQNSNEGWAAGGSIPGHEKNVKKPFLMR